MPQETAHLPRLKSCIAACFRNRLKRSQADFRELRNSPLRQKARWWSDEHVQRDMAAMLKGRTLVIYLTPSLQKVTFQLVF
ncbi:hypothetical protein M404DRAFT_998211 [Pisolithus tinctorius Marx 270]|uniref:Uncharacterized protein n=1 Tax=Pisolithus tinctorius Marx 270 TaxID=870435 RepID=A0A0C3PGI2_PISTI|nr:hypothetical protein M404DRAFT_998211 [Pisolithus tinctorius Marx 270]